LRKGKAMNTKNPKIIPFRNYVPAPELSFYRNETLALLRRYFRMSIAVGRMPNIMGREVFRAKLNNPRITGFEDVVILVTDVEHILARLDPFAQQLINRCVLQEYPFEDAAPLLKCNEKTVRRRLPDAIDQVTELLLQTGLIKNKETHKARGRPNAQVSVQNQDSGNSCQAPSEDDFAASA